MFDYREIDITPGNFIAIRMKSLPDIERTCEVAASSGEITANVGDVAGLRKVARCPPQVPGPRVYLDSAIIQLQRPRIVSAVLAAGAQAHQNAGARGGVRACEQ